MSNFSAISLYHSWREQVNFDEMMSTLYKTNTLG